MPAKTPAKKPAKPAKKPAKRIVQTLNVNAPGKTYPRDDVRHNINPTDAEIDAAESFNQTRRMLRRGITFGPELTEEDEG